MLVNISIYALHKNNKIIFLAKLHGYNVAIKGFYVNVISTIGFSPFSICQLRMSFFSNERKDIPTLDVRFLFHKQHNPLIILFHLSSHIRIYLESGTTTPDCDGYLI